MKTWDGLSDLCKKYNKSVNTLTESTRKVLTINGFRFSHKQGDFSCP